jgi:hypothetical protein
MPKPIKTLRASKSVTPDAKGQWLVLIGDSGETSADDIEAFFADIWSPTGGPTSVCPSPDAPGRMAPPMGRQVH